MSNRRLSDTGTDREIDMIVKICSTNGTDYLFQCDELRHERTETLMGFPDTNHILDCATKFDGKTSIKGKFLLITNGSSKPKSIFTNCIAYLMNDNGKTIEKL